MLPSAAKCPLSIALLSLAAPAFLNAVPPLVTDDAEIAKKETFELYVGYENELKVKPGVYVWSWVEPQRIQDQFDVIRFEICATNGNQEQVVSLSRAIIHEDTSERASL